MLFEWSINEKKHIFSIYGSSVCLTDCTCNRWGWGSQAGTWIMASVDRKQKCKHCQPHDVVPWLLGDRRGGSSRLMTVPQSVDTWVTRFLTLLSCVTSFRVTRTDIFWCAGLQSNISNVWMETPGDSDSNRGVCQVTVTFLWLVFNMYIQLNKRSFEYWNLYSCNYYSFGSFSENSPNILWTVDTVVTVPWYIKTVLHVWKWS